VDKKDVNKVFYITVRKIFTVAVLG